MKTLKQGTIKRLHVNRHVVAANRKQGRDDPALTIQTSSGPIRTKLADIMGPSQLIQAKKPLPCGAKVWIYTKAEVNYLEHVTNE